MKMLLFEFQAHVKLITIQERESMPFTGCMSNLQETADLVNKMHA